MRCCICASICSARRSVWDKKTPLIALASSGVLNVLPNLFFVVVLRMTVEGVAIATVVSNAVSAAILYSRLRKHSGDIHVELRKLCIDRRVLGQTLRIGVPAALTVLGICGVRIVWILLAFPQDPTFETILTAYPISLFATALFLAVALVIYRPASRLEKAAKAAKN